MTWASPVPSSAQLMLCPCCCIYSYNLEGTWIRTQPTRRISFQSLLVMASYGHYSQCAARIGPDHICLIWLPTSCSITYFLRKPSSYCAKPAHIQSGWPDWVLAKWTGSGSQLVCKNHQAQFWQTAISHLSVSHFQTLLCSCRDGGDLIAQHQPRSDLVLADCVRFWPNGSGLEASTSHQACFWPMLPTQSRLDMNWILHVYWEVWHYDPSKCNICLSWCLQISLVLWVFKLLEGHQVMCPMPELSPVWLTSVQWQPSFYTVAGAWLQLNTEMFCWWRWPSII